MKRILVAVLSAIALVVLGMGPVAAQTIPTVPTTIPPHVAGIVFDGTATTGSIFAPVAVPCGVAICAGATGVSWSFTIAGPGTTGVAFGYHYEPPPGPTSTQAYVGAGAAAGGVTGGTVNPGVTGDGGWCGYSSGAGGSGTITIAEPNRGDIFPNQGVTTTATGSQAIGVGSVGWFQSAATFIVFTGNVTSDNSAPTTGTIAGVVSAIPPNAVTGGTGSCVADASGATGFRVVGAALAYWN